MENPFVILLAGLALSACGGVRLQTADELGNGLYQTGQAYNREQCLKFTSPTASECLRREGMRYEDYKREREKSQTSVL